MDDDEREALCVILEALDILLSHAPPSAYKNEVRDKLSASALALRPAPRT